MSTKEWHSLKHQKKVFHLYLPQKEIRPPRVSMVTLKKSFSFLANKEEKVGTKKALGHDLIRKNLLKKFSGKAISHMTHMLNAILRLRFRNYMIIIINS